MSGCTCSAIIFWRGMLLAEWDSKSSIVALSIMVGSSCPMYSPLLKVMCLLV